MISFDYADYRTWGSSFRPSSTSFEAINRPQASLPQNFGDSGSLSNRGSTTRDLTRREQYVSGCSQKSGNLPQFEFGTSVHSAAPF